MGKDHAKKRNKPFVMLYKDVLRSPAWEALTNPARVAYLHIRLDENGHNEGQLRLPYSQAIRLMDKRTFTSALRQLQELGFIIVTKHGGLYNQCSEFGLSTAWRDWRPDQAQAAARGQRRKCAMAKVA